jgi:NTE family protein
VIWTKGSLRQAVMSSSAIPGFFPPQIVGTGILVDGGWTNSVPVRPALSLGANVVVAVDTSRGSEEIFQFKRGLDLIIRTAQIMMKKLREMQLEEAEVLIQPAVMDIHWADFMDPDRVIELGRQAALPKVKDIQAAMRRGFRQKILRDALDLTKIYQKILPERGEQ